MSSRRPTRSQSRQPDASLPSIPSTITRRQRRPAMPASATPRASIAAVSRERARLSLGDATPTPTTSTTNTITTITKRRHSLLSPHFDPRSLPTRVGPVRPSAEFALRALLQVGTVTDGQESVLDDAKLEICKGFEDTRHTYLSPTRLFFKPIPTEPDIVNSTFVLSNLTTFLFLVLSSSDRTDESSQDLLRAASGFWVYVWSIAAEGDVDYDEEDGIRLLVAILRQSHSSVQLRTKTGLPRFHLSFFPISRPQNSNPDYTRSNNFPTSPITLQLPHCLHDVGNSSRRCGQGRPGNLDGMEVEGRCRRCEGVR
ncbi:hypothetical protein T439DRAFT_88605 [Meredithblackwellia eburnea MCA 4105]